MWKPAHDLEAQLRLQGISRDYVIPDEVLPKRAKGDDSSNDERLQAFMEQGRANNKSKILRDTVLNVIKHNAELQVLLFDPRDDKEVYHVGMGIATGFNPDDTQYFIDRERRIVNAGITFEINGEPLPVEVDTSEPYRAELVKKWGLHPPEYTLFPMARTTIAEIERQLTEQSPELVDEPEPPATGIKTSAVEYIEGRKDGSIPPPPGKPRQ